MKVSVVIPSIGRPSLKCVLAAAKSEADEVILMENTGLELVENLNKGVEKTTGDIIVFLSERGEPCLGWKNILLDGFKRIQNHGVVSFHPVHVQSGGISRSYLKEIGGYFFWPEYIHYHADQELGERARKDLHYVEIFDVIKEYAKPIQNEVKRSKVVDHDWNIYHKREPLFFPNYVIHHHTECSAGRNTTCKQSYKKTNH